MNVFPSLTVLGKIDMNVGQSLIEGCRSCERVPYSDRARED